MAGNPNKTVKTVTSILASAGVLWSVFYVLGGAPRLNVPIGLLQFLHVGASLFLPLVFILRRATNAASRDRVPWYDIVAAVLAFLIPLYLMTHYRQSQYGAWAFSPPTLVVYLGVIMVALVIEGTRRAAGTFMATAALLLALSPLYVHFLPGIFKGATFGIHRIVGTLFISANGMFGSVMSVFILTFLLFIFFGVVLQAAGAGRFFTNIALALLGETRGGAAKVAVIASSLFGTVSGSATANVMVSGSFTIPMMKASGLPGERAAAIEAAASEGGILMPPVMGAVAFVMADFLGIPYWRVAVAAAVPAVLYYWCLFCQVHRYAVNHGLRGVPRDQVPPLGRTVIEGWHIPATFVVLVLTLFVLKISPGQAALWTTISLFLFTALNKFTRSGIVKVIRESADSGRIFAQLAPIILAVGLIIGGLDLSGLSVSVVQWMGGIASNNVATALLVVAAASFVLGTGLPAMAVYILLAILLAPVLEGMGLNRIAVHLTILYWGILSDFTPPTAITPFVAAGFADASPLKTALHTMRFGVVIFLAPLFFVFRPVLILQDFQLLPFMLLFLFAVVGLWLLAQALEGYAPPETSTQRWMRLACLVGAGMILSLVWYIQIAGVLVAAAIVLVGRAGDSAARRADVKRQTAESTGPQP